MTITVKGTTVELTPEQETAMFSAPAPAAPVTAQPTPDEVETLTPTPNV